MHQNDVFLFLKKLFLISAYQNDSKTLKIINFKHKKLNFLETQVDYVSKHGII
jgi:hypothetical protein